MRGAASDGWTLGNAFCHGICNVMAVVCAAAIVTGCAESARKDELESAKNTILCQLDGERLVIRFELGDARMLMANGERVTLYHLPSASSARYSNGFMELRGKGTDFELVRDGVTSQLAGCAPYTPPK